MKELEYSIMRFAETKIYGAYIIDIERREDHRGFFTNTGAHITRERAVPPSR